VKKFAYLIPAVLNRAGWGGVGGPVRAPSPLHFRRAVVPRLASAGGAPPRRQPRTGAGEEFPSSPDILKPGAMQSHIPRFFGRSGKPQCLPCLLIMLCRNMITPRQEVFYDTRLPPNRLPLGDYFWPPCPPRRVPDRPTTTTHAEPCAYVPKMAQNIFW
jgi:hypothetical protein